MALSDRALRDDTEAGGALFTHFLLRELSKGDGRLLVQDCYPEVRKATRRASVQVGSLQEPECFLSGQVDVCFGP